MKEKPEPGEMHPVDKAFYDLTVKERDFERRMRDKAEALLEEEREARKKAEQAELENFAKYRGTLMRADRFEERAEKAEAALLEAREALKVADGWLQHGPGATTHEHASDVVRAALASYEGNHDA